jgi:hypothetical protein
MGPDYTGGYTVYQANFVLVVVSIMATQSNKAFQVFGHFVKSNGENYSKYRCEFLFSHNGRNNLT